jgi:acyl-CoA thioester hydrolase
MLREHEIEIRVRYQETDGQGRVHHANYLTWFELARVEMLRAAGISYKQIEQDGLLLVVAEMHCRYYLPAEFDDLLRIHVKTLRAKGARIEHQYRVLRGEELLVEANSTIACVDRRGKVARLPDWLRLDSPPSE